MMMSLAAILLLPVVLVAGLTSVYALEVLMGCFWRRDRSINDMDSKFTGRITVLIPAHNEQNGIGPTISDIKGQLKPGDRVVVVADNCSDLTAVTALSLGAEVTIRSDTSRRGKGYALAWGLDFLAPNPPDVVVIIDADCRIVGGTLACLALEAITHNRAVQSLYLMNAPSHSRVSQEVAEFAWRVKNQLRPLGLKALGLPCQLMGTGMAFPWTLIRSANLSNGHIVEDLKLGVDLAVQGSAPRFCPHVVVSSTFPASTDGVRTQRQRWEHGHIRMIVDSALPCLKKGILGRNVDQIAMGLDLLVPPLSLLSLLIVALLGITGATAIAGFGSYPFLLATVCASLFFIATCFAWLKAGRDVLPGKSLLQIPVYIISKVPVYLKLVVGRGVSVWIRSDRT